MSLAQNESARMEEDTQLNSMHRIEELEKVGVTVADLKKLRRAGFVTVESVAYSAKKYILITRASRN